MNSLEDRFSKAFDVPLNKVEMTDSLLLDLICINNYYSTRGGDSFIFPKKKEGLKEEVLTTLMLEKSNRPKVKVRLQRLFNDL